MKKKKEKKVFIKSCVLVFQHLGMSSYPVFNQMKSLEVYGRLLHGIPLSIR